MPLARMTPLLLVVACEGDWSKQHTGGWYVDSAGETGATDSAETAGETADETGLAHSGETGGADSGETGEPHTGFEPSVSEDAPPDFELADLNPGSARYGERVSPRDYLEQVSGWYFTHAT